MAALAVYAWYGDAWYADAGYGGDGAPRVGDAGTHGRGAEADADLPAYPSPKGEVRRAHGDGRKPHGDGRKPHGDGRKPHGDGRKPHGGGCSTDRDV